MRNVSWMKFATVAALLLTSCAVPESSFEDGDGTEAAEEASPETGEISQSIEGAVCGEISSDGCTKKFSCGGGRFRVCVRDEGNARYTLELRNNDGTRRSLRLALAGIPDTICHNVASGGLTAWHGVLSSRPPTPQAVQGNPSHCPTP
jgi:hypothetical protein